MRQIEFEDSHQRGFYQLELTRTDGRFEQTLYAANIDPSEGNLRPLSEDSRRRITSEKVRILSGAEAAALTLGGSSTEIWKLVLVLAAVVLCGEQILGWVFGRRR